MRPSPLRIILTGINGAGKDTHARALATWLSLRDGLSAEALYAPTITPAAATFRAGVLEHQPYPAAELAGYLSQHLESADAIRARQHRTGAHVIINRGPETALVYNCYARAPRLPRDVIRMGEQMHRVALRILEPTVTVYLRIGLEASRTRRALQPESDHIQERDDGFYGRMIAAYDDLACNPRWLTIDAEPPVDRVFEALTRDLAHYLDNL